jgi:GNAT superfamily N-acetyltransferase
MNVVRPCRADEQPQVLSIINAASQAYRGIIPADCWHEPYMTAGELEREVAAGVRFWGVEEAGQLLGVMGIQEKADVDLIRHAYVWPAMQGRGIGGVLLAHLECSTRRRILIGTWADATWAIRFYERHGYELVTDADKTSLLRTYWTVSDRQIETSVVLAKGERKP